MSGQEERVIYQHQGMTYAFTKREDACVQHAFMPVMNDEVFEHVALPPFQIAVAGRQYGGLPAIGTAQTEIPYQMKLVSSDVSSDGFQLTYLHAELGLELTTLSSSVPGCAVMRSVTKVRNVSSEPITLTHLSSAYLQGIALGGCRPWHDKQKIRVHYCRQSWAGEGQWHAASLEELGMYPTAKHSARAAMHLWGEGSWSTGRYNPMIVLEDMETSQVWFAQIETASPWHFEVGMRGSIWDQGKWGFYLQADGASERYGAWSHTLLPGETFTSVPVAVGCCEGDFEDAIRELTYYRRTVLKREVPGFSAAPVLFNDYMNCIWADPTADKLKPIIESAARVGVEVFCIDAGWFANPNAKGHRILGDWHPSETKFGPDGVAGMLAFIRDQGMVPGLWMEMEVCGEDSDLGKRPDDWFLRIRGRRVGGGDRWFLNFTNPEVRAYLHDAIDQVVALGAGYVKNDYNACIGLGDDELGSSPAAGLIRHTRAFYDFIDEVRHRHPKLILENCGCGAMRLDYGTQSHFHLASYSDQESYEYAPSILGGSLATLLPEQLGIWAYPFPLIIDHKNTPEILQSEAYLATQADGEQTIFNMVNGLCGALCLSGRIDAADARNFELILEGVEVFKQQREFKSTAYPVWPLGMSHIGDADAWASVGLLSEDGDRLLLAVWRRETSSEYCELPLRGFAGRNAVVTQIYPTSSDYAVDTYYNRVKGTVTVKFPKRNQARYFEIRKI